MAYDTEDHDVREVMEEEEWRERAGEEMERTYFKTLAMVDVMMEENDAAAWGTSQRWALPQRRERWYFRTDGTILPPCTTSGCQWRTCRRRWEQKSIRWRFNKSGMEADYAVME